MAKKSLNLEDAALWKKVTDTVTPIDREDWIIEYETEFRMLFCVRVDLARTGRQIESLRQT